MAKLTFTLTDLLERANARPGQTVTKTLKNGLLISVTNATGKIFLTLSRAGVYPSDTELTTVLNHWPYRVDDHTAPSRFVIRGQFCVAVNWPITERVTR